MIVPELILKFISSCTGGGMGLGPTTLGPKSSMFISYSLLSTSNYMFYNTHVQKSHQLSSKSLPIVDRIASPTG